MKTTEEIYQAMLAEFARRAGYQPGDTCDLAVRLYALAAQAEALYIQADWVLTQSFPQTAAGIYLDRHGETRGIARSAAVAAEGVVRFSVDAAAPQALPIPAGTVCMTADGVRFATTEAAQLEVGDTCVDVPARAVEPGSRGNVGAGLVIAMAVPPAGIVRCVNPGAFTGGTDEEDDESLRRRILDSYRRLPNGANAAFYEQTALSYPGVAAATAVGRARGIGTVDVYVAATGGTPDSDLLQQIQQELEDKREIAVDVQVLAPEEQEVDITVDLLPAEGYTFAQAETAAEAALTAYFTGALLGKGVTLAALGNLLFQLPGVSNYAFTAPAADVAPAVGKLPVLGTVTIGEVE